MKKSIFTVMVLMFVLTISKAQTTAMQFIGVDCSGNPVNLFSDLDAGKAVVLFYYMPSCGSCPPPAQKIQKMANNINAKYPGKVKGYAFPFQNVTTCSYSSSWVSSNGLSSIYTAMDSGEAQVAHYGGFGMPTVVVVGGKDHKVLFSTLSFSTSDTTEMRNKILALLEGTSSVDLPTIVSTFKIFPNPTTDNTTITIDLKETSNVKIDIIDITGKQIVVVMDENQRGLITKQFNTAILPKGLYFVRLQTDGKTITQKISVTN